MFRSTRSRLFCAFAGGLTILAVAVQTADAQPPATSRPEIAPGKTDVTLELVVDQRGALAAQAWRNALKDLGIPVRMKFGLSPDSKPETRERVVGTLRYVQLRGVVDSKGKILFTDRSFGRSEMSKLKEWVHDLQTYGAQGAPDGQPAWGLNKSQFGRLIKDLAEPVKEIREGDDLEGSVKRLQTGSRYNLRYSTSARQWINSHAALKVVRQNIVSLSRGTALACLLNDAGLGFRPLRTPSGTIELVIEERGSVEKLWPVGWEIPKDRSRYRTAPKLFELLPVELNDVPYLDVIQAISLKTQLPVVMDYYNIETRSDMKIDKLKVSYPSRKVSWLQVLRGISSPNRLSVELMVDERDRPFIHVDVLGQIAKGKTGAGSSSK